MTLEAMNLSSVNLLLVIVNVTKFDKMKKPLLEDPGVQLMESWVYRMR